MAKKIRNTTRALQIAKKTKQSGTYSSAVHKVSAQELQDKFGAMVKVLTEQFMERNEVIKGCVLSLLAQKHLFLLSPPGTAKSALIKLLARTFAGCHEFKIQLDKQTRYEKVYGPLDLDKLRKEYVYLTEGYFPWAHVAFIDEIWKANASILDSFLWMTDESREFRNGKDVSRTPLISAFCASNELPADDGLNAHYDRFMMRYMVQSIMDDSNFVKMLETENLEGCPGLMSMDDLFAAQAQVNEVSLVGTAPNLAELRKRLKEKGMMFSDRRWKESLKILQAHAWLRGGDEVELQDFDILQYVFWNRPPEFKEASKIILSMSNPEIQKALDIKDKVTELYTNAMSANTTAAGTEASDKIKTLLRELKTLKRNRKVEDILSDVKRMQSDIIQQCLGFTVGDE